MLDIISVIRDGKTYCTTEAGWKFIVGSSEFLKYWKSIRDYLDSNNVSYDENDFLNLYFPTKENCHVHATGWITDKQIKIEVIDEDSYTYFRDTKDIRSNTVEELVSYIMKLNLEEGSKRVKKVSDALSRIDKFFPDRCCCSDDYTPEKVRMKNDIDTIKTRLSSLVEAVNNMAARLSKLERENNETE